MTGDTPAGGAATPVVAAVIERGGRYLLARRPEEKRHGGLWEFPGGKLDDGESMLDAARRELDEELGLTVEAVGTVLHAVHDQGAPFRIEFVRVVASGVPERREHSEVGWFTPEEMAGLSLAPADAVFAARLRADARVS